MGWRISAKISEILTKGADGGGIGHDEALTLLCLELHSREVYALMETANRLSRTRFKGKGENHFHIGLNVATLPSGLPFLFPDPQGRHLQRVR